MQKTITVRGVGRASAAPDWIILSMILDSRSPEYEKAMDLAVESVDVLTQALVGAGFEENGIKTTDFNVRADYENRCGEDGRYETVFSGYVVNHSLKLEFVMDTARLSKALSVIGSCLAHPQLSIGFTVKDQSFLGEEMLRSAAENARKKAEVLCAASGKKLGELLSVDYNLGQMNVFSQTRYAVDEECMKASGRAKFDSVNIAPDDIKVSDNVTFVWEIE